jgi:hypothetical protein
VSKAIARGSAFVAMVLCGCQKMPDPYAPATTRKPIEDYRRLTPVVNMADPDAQSHFLRDISDTLNTSWRWCEQRPAVRVPVGSNRNLKFSIDLALAEATLKDTGPVTLSFYVNGHLVDHVRYTLPGKYHFEKAVPPDWVAPESDAILEAEIDKLWVSKDNGSKLGFILTRIGLTP